MSFIHYVILLDFLGISNPCSQITLKYYGTGVIKVLIQPGGGNVKIENRKLEWSAQARTVAANDRYTPGGGDKKVFIFH